MQARDKVKFQMAMDGGYQKRVSGEVVAVNVAIHPQAKRWGLSLISTGKSIGRFNDRADAESFATQAVSTTPELKDADPQLRPDQVAALIELRKALRGTKY